MCFSAISRFSASIIIGGIGVSTVKKTTAKKILLCLNSYNFYNSANM